MTQASFKSAHYPTTSSRIAALQAYAMEYFGWIALVLMIGMLGAVARGVTQGVLGWMLFGAIGGLLLANAMAYVGMRRRYAQIFFVGDHFSVISVYDILFENTSHAFPLRYANPSRNEDTLSFTYNDQIINLHKKDWDELDLIWEWFQIQPEAPGGTGPWQSTVS